MEKGPCSASCVAIVGSEVEFRVKSFRFELGFYTGRDLRHSCRLEIVEYRSEEEFRREEKEGGKNEKRTMV